MKTKIDLTSKHGEAMALVVTAKKASKKLEMNSKPIIEDMMSGDYEHLCDVFVEHFGDYFELVEGDE